MTNWIRSLFVPIWRGNKMSWRTLLSFVFIFSSFTSFGDVVEKIEGSTQKEREIRWLWKYTSAFVRSCVVSGNECKNSEIRPVAEKLLQQMPAAPARLRFVSEKQNPNLFRSDTNEEHRIAVTEAKPGSDIYINTDLMDRLDHSRWIGLLVHEAVHHLGLPDDSTRLPDRVGAAVAVHAMAHWETATMAEFGHPSTALIFFNDPAMDRPTRILIHTSKYTLDQNATPNPRVPICGASEKFIGQAISSPLWRVRRLRGDKKLATVSASARVHSRCRNAAGTERQVLTNFTFLTELNFSKTFQANEAWWEVSSEINLPSLRAGNSDGEEEMLDLNRTFIVRSVEYNQSTLNAGDEWQTRVVVESSDGFAPKQCQGFFSGSKWFFSRQVNTTMLAEYSNCKITPKQNKLYEVQMNFTFPKNTQPDSFALSFIVFGGEFHRFAIPSRPQFVQLNNRSAAPSMQASGWRVLGLKELPSAEGKALKNSYMIGHNQPFWLEVDVLGTQKIKNQFFDIDFFAETPSGQVLYPWNVTLDHYKKLSIVLKTEELPIPGGVRLRYQMQLPPSLSSMRLVGFKLQRVSLETDDMAWAELEIPNFLEGFFLTGNH